MTNSQRWLVIATLTVMTIILPLIFLHFGSETVGFEAATGKMLDCEQIVDLNPLADSLGVGDNWGVWSNPGEPFGEAVAIGILAPIMLLATAVYTLLGMRRRISN